MGIRIPTGIVQLSAEFQRKRLIGYKCTNCGKQHFSEYALKTTVYQNYHVFGGEKAKQKAEEKLRERAIQNLDKQDSEVFDAINNHQDYGKIYEKITCPDCQTVQPWSQLPLPWRLTTLWGLWVGA